MIEELSIKDFAIISNLTVNFDEGMTVLTGETGAGKSIVIDALGLLVGGRGSTEFIRTGSKKCQLEGLFSLEDNHLVWNYLDELGIEYPDNQLIIHRDLTTSGKNICRINGCLVNTTILKKIGRYLVDIQGQSDQQILMQPENHLKLLDKYDSIDQLDIYIKYQEKYQTYKELKKQLDSKKENEQAYNQRIDMLKYQINEIEEASLESETEEEDLLEEKKKLDNYLNIVEQLQTTKSALDDDTSGALNALSAAMNAMDNIADLSEDYQKISESLTTMYYNLQDISSEVSSNQDGLEMDEDRLSYVDDRLSVIYQLERKYGEDIKSILNYYNNIVEEYQSLSSSDVSITELENTVTKLFDDCLALAEKLSKARKEAAVQLKNDIQEQLSDLYMEQATFEVKFKPNKELSSFGIDDLEFYISTNTGEDAKPLVKIVSGGELSRIVLALKSILTEVNGITSIVFDEVDTGVSGRVAQAIAEKIHQIGHKSQVICITHLPQVAAIADHQYYIQKNVVENRTEMNLQLLKEQERTKEIARMLSGSEITDLTLKHAEELLQKKN